MKPSSIFLLAALTFLIGMFVGAYLSQTDHVEKWKMPLTQQMQMEDGSTEEALVFMKDQENYQRLMNASKGDRASFSGTFGGVYPIFRDVEVKLEQ